MQVSVPLRGKYRGECYEDEMLNLWFVVKFPSPCGVNIVANQYHLDMMSKWASEVSVPLRGKYRGELLLLHLLLLRLLRLFPSPCGVNIVAN